MSSHTFESLKLFHDSSGYVSEYCPCLLPHNPLSASVLSVNPMNKIIEKDTKSKIENHKN